MNVLIDNSVKKIGLENCSFCLISNIKIKESSSFLKFLIKKRTDLAFQSEIALNSPVKIGCDLLYKDLGYKNVTPAGVRVFSSFKKKGFKFINNVVDSCNLISLENCYGLGLHDYNKVEGLIELKRADGCEKIIPLFKKKESDIILGDLIYLCRKGVLARLGKQDVDSDKFKIEAITTSVLVVALGNKNTSHNYNLNICLELFELLKKEQKDITFTELDIL